MATKVDAVAAKQRQQKIILAVGGLLLVGLLVLQGPKLFKHHGSTSSSTAPAAGTSTTPAAGTTGTSTSGTAVPAVATARPTGPAAEVAGVIVRSAGAPVARTGQLWSLSRFKVKDPFVRQVADTSSTVAGSTTSPSTPAKGGTGGASRVGGVAAPSTSSPVALGYATLMVNGRPQQLALKDIFPKGQPTFVLLGVDNKSIRIGVAGGKFTGGAAVKLELGKPVTLMNTTTGQRFVIKLVFTGTQPEHIAGFKPPTSTTITSKQSSSTTTP
jgi:hypothetical protein